MEERLRQFVTVVDCGSFTAAARKLHISQPALSVAMAKLERELQASLLVRGQKPLQASPAGKLAYDFASSHARHTRQLRERLAQQAGARATLRIGLIDSLGELLCQDNAALTTLEGSYQLSLIVNNSGALRTMVERNELDYAFVVAGSEDRVIGQEPLLYVQAAAKTADRFISYNFGSSTYRLVEQAFAAAGQPLRPDFYSTSPEVMCQLVLSGRGKAVLPYLSVAKDLASKRLRVVTLGSSHLLWRPVSAIRTERHPSYPAVSALLTRALANVEWQARTAHLSPAEI